MLSVGEATKVIRKNLPKGDIQAVVPYRDLYLFQVFRDALGEQQMDPFYSVHQQTGEFKEFSILTDGDISEINNLFVAAKKERR